jgi:hypothetical protein
MRGKFSTHGSFRVAEWLREIAVILIPTQGLIFHSIGLTFQYAVLTSFLHLSILRLRFEYGVWFAASATTPTMYRCGMFLIGR